MRSDEVYPVRQLPALGAGTREMRRQFPAAYLDRGNEPIPDPVFPHMRRQRVDGCLPFGLPHARGDAVIGDNSGVTLRQRNEDEDPAAILLASNAADGELLGCRTV